MIRLKNDFKVFCSAIVVSVINTQTALAQADGDMNMGFALLRTVVVLFLVLGLFFLIVYLARKYYPKYFNALPVPSREAEEVKVISIKTLGPKKYVYHLRLEDRNFLVAFNDNSTTVLGSWQQKKETDFGSVMAKQEQEKSDES